MVLTLIEMVRGTVNNPIVMAKAKAMVPFQIVMARAIVKVKVKVMVKETVSQIR
jgi:hypothetical protein